MQELNSAIEELEAAKGTLGGEIVVGAMLFVGDRLLATVINEFGLAHPDASIRVGSGNARVMFKSLRSGDVDFVIEAVPEKLEIKKYNPALRRQCFEGPSAHAGRMKHGEFVAARFQRGLEVNHVFEAALAE